MLSSILLDIYDIYGDYSGGDIKWGISMPSEQLVSEVSWATIDTPA